jgi:hypothetical protein
MNEVAELKEYIDANLKLNSLPLVPRQCLNDLMGESKIDTHCQCVYELLQVLNENKHYDPESDKEWALRLLAHVYKRVTYSDPHCKYQKHAHYFELCDKIETIKAILAAEPELYTAEIERQLDELCKPDLVISFRYSNKLEDIQNLISVLGKAEYYQPEARKEVLRVLEEIKIYTQHIFNFLNAPAARKQ